MSRLITFLFLFSCFSTYAQKAEFAPKLKVYSNKKANTRYQVFFLDTTKDTLMKKENIVFNSLGDTLSYQLTTKPDWTKADTLNKNATAPNNVKNKPYLYADIKPDEGRLLVYFWPYKTLNKKGNIITGSDSIKIAAANTFFDNHSFSIEVKDRVNLGFTSSSWQAGVLTLPIKVYIGGPDSVSAVQAAVNAGLYLGKKWGRTRYIKLPNEKEFTSYQKTFSLNAFTGINKLDLDEKNTKDAGKKFKGSVTSLSIGITPGFHYKKFTFFLASGFDIPLSTKAKNWTLKGKQWVGFGAGFDIF